MLPLFFCYSKIVRRISFILRLGSLICLVMTTVSRPTAGIGSIFSTGWP